MPRFRIEYSKKGPITFISHLDLTKVWERAARRANLPVALSQGFHPHYRISFGSVLPVGIAGEKEYLDIELTEDLAPETVKQALSNEMTEGILITELLPIPDQAPSLMARIDTAEYYFSVGLKECLEESDLAGRWRRMQEIDRWLVTRRGKKGEQEVDARSGLFKAELKCEGNRLTGTLWLKVGGSSNVRPQEVLKALEKYAQIPLDWDDLCIYRSALYVNRGGEMVSPLVV